MHKMYNYCNIKSQEIEIVHLLKNDIRKTEEGRQ